jgi:hypothetical protein
MRSEQVRAQLMQLAAYWDDLADERDLIAKLEKPLRGNS